MSGTPNVMGRPHRQQHSIKRSQGAPGLKSPPMMLKGAWPYLTDEFVEYLNENGMMQKGQPTDRSRPETVMAYGNPLM
ncbi:hypothetical protein POTOM_036458 [Populus tomentosa]|uniref:Uncharacterized protein n=1 Tax=Populus tomentosa TaxID=118781 RepID=A0A8X7Z092_POPTO|nr:hypothetical protein POTOM_036458 [Populus tomentosa]